MVTEIQTCSRETRGRVRGNRTRVCERAWWGQGARGTRRQHSMRASSKGCAGGQGLKMGGQGLKMGGKRPPNRVLDVRARTHTDCEGC